MKKAHIEILKSRMHYEKKMQKAWEPIDPGVAKWSQAAYEFARSLLRDFRKYDREHPND